MTFSTLAQTTIFADEPVKGSRFIGLAAPAGDEAAALATVEGARARWPDATHHTWAFRLRGGRHRHSDDGEPGGSAGRPILAQIDGHGLVDVVVVVVRWFGGTKLGVGGLIRAYGAAAGRTLDRAPILEVVPHVDLILTHSYDDIGAIGAVVGSWGLEVIDTRWGASVQQVLRVPEARRRALIDTLRDRTGGRVDIEPFGAEDPP
ncbi:MAG TPA: DUF1949 domain-containing protein [Deltaproteobacteria bacterium]|nr:DUF1949 domain-containing protein [Deltaproteobacteria bacterium]